jgi:hypothetical protein
MQCRAAPSGALPIAPDLGEAVSSAPETYPGQSGSHLAMRWRRRGTRHSGVDIISTLHFKEATAVSHPLDLKLARGQS